MPRLMLTLAYVGTSFVGWQAQAPGQGRTVQQELEKAATQLAGRFIRVHGAGRTDSGVHALGQVAHIDVAEDKLKLPWLGALNALLPSEIAVTRVEKVDKTFHSRFSATAKTYSYTFFQNKDFLLPQRAPFVWQVSGLDFSLMDECAQIFIGCHDFAAFQNKGTRVKDTQREILAIWRESGLTAFEQVYYFRGRGFLKQMVRNLTGMLYEAGRGKVSPSHVRSVLTSRDRSLAAPTAPAKGLCLVNVEYGEGGDRAEPGSDKSGSKP